MSDVVYRRLGGEPEEALEPVKRGRNIIAVIGIDDYVYWRKLNNAVSDAQGVLDLFTGLGFQTVVDPLFNAAASLEGINSLVIDELPSRLKEEDSLVLFFAGHGHTETSSAGGTPVRTGYLIPAGGRLPQEKKFSSLIRLETFLQEVADLPPRHVLVILDACYSGFALGQAVTVLRDNPRYTEDLDRRVSRHVITSAMHDQPALDGGPVPGHSLFTGVLIEALKDEKADTDRKGFITGSELSLYVQKTVGAYAESRSAQQTPDFGAFADEIHQRGELVIALRGETQNKKQAAECLEIGRRLEDVARLTGDRKRFVTAAGQYAEAIKFASLAKSAYPEAELGLGRARLAAGAPAEAIKVLSALVEREVNSCPPDALFFLGLAYAQTKDYVPAAAALEAWQAENSQDPRAAWTGEYVGWLRGAAQHPGGRKLALLIGIDQYNLKDIPVALQGCVNDASKLMKTALIRTCGFPEEAVTVLTDEAATRQNVLKALEQLCTGSSPEDTVFVHYSGHSVPSSLSNYFGKNSVENVYLIMHDTNNEPGYLTNGITAQELHDRVQTIPAGHKTLVLDTHASQELIELARREGTYALIVASDTAEVAYEWQVPIDGEEVRCGLLTGALYQSLEKAGGGEALTYREWMLPAIEIAHQASSNPQFPQVQTPYFSGLPERCIFGGEDPYLEAFEFVQRGRWPERTLDQLEKEYRLLHLQVAAPLPGLHGAFGRAFQDAGAFALAVEAIRREIESRPEGSPESWLSLGIAHLRAGEWGPARQALEKASQGAGGDLKDELDRLLAGLAHLDGIRRKAVLILPDVDPGKSPEAAPETTAQLQALQETLVQRYRLREEDIRVLPGSSASEENILAELKRLSEGSGKDPALFFIAGLGILEKINASPGEGSRIGNLPLAAFEQAARQSGQLFVWVQLTGFVR